MPTVLIESIRNNVGGAFILRQTKNFLQMPGMFSKWTERLYFHLRLFQNYHKFPIPAIGAQLQPDQELIQEILGMEQKDNGYWI